MITLVQDSVNRHHVQSIVTTLRIWRFSCFCCSLFYHTPSNAISKPDSRFKLQWLLCN